MALLLLLPCLSSCNHILRSNENAADIAREEYGMETVFTVGKAPQEYTRELHSPYCLAVIGEKDGEELFLAVPAELEKEPFLIEWPFVLSFRQMVTLLNKSCPDVTITEEAYRYFMIGPDIDDYLDGAENRQEEFDVYYSMAHEQTHYVLVQQNGQIVIYDTLTQRPVEPSQNIDE